MSMDNLLIRKKNANQSLELLVKELSVLLGCSSWEQRESSHYPENRYFRCFVLGIEIKICADSYADYPMYDFLVFFSREIFFHGDKGVLTGVADCCARKLAANGYDVLRVGNRDEEAIVYRKNPDVTAKLSPIITQVIPPRLKAKS